MKMNVFIKPLPGITPVLFVALLWATETVFGMNVTDMATAKLYLKKYFMADSYSNSKFGELTQEVEMEAALLEYQTFMGLEPTGQLDAETIKMMEMPRCGVPDLYSPADDVKKRRKRYTLQGSKFDNSSPLTYRFKTAQYSRDLSNTEVAATIAKAFKYWSDVTNLDFLFTTSNVADIDILFASGEHDNEGPDGAFDGTGGTLAHAYFPQYGGDAHFDEDERWTINTYSGTNLLQVAVHEIGHSLGLSHSSVQGAIMYPTYRGYIPNFTLNSDDILGIQQIYGVRTTTTTATPGSQTTTTTTTAATTTTKKTTSTTTPQDGSTSSTVQPTPSSNFERFCRDLSFDAITTFGGKTFAFKDDLYVEIDNSGIVPGYPRLISDDWPGAPNNIDAALYWHENNPPRLYIFKGSQYWRYEMTSSGYIFLRSGYPRLIASGFQGIPNNIDSAFVWGRNGKTYIFKDPVYYRLYRDQRTNRTRGQVDPGYPRNTQSGWRLPQTYNAVFRWDNGRTYFFDGNSYIRYDDFRVQIDQNANPPYPRPIDRWWVNCAQQGIRQDMEMDSKQDKEFIVVTQVDNNDGVTPNTIGGATTVRQTVLAVLIAASFTIWQL